MVKRSAKIYEFYLMLMIGIVHPLNSFDPVWTQFHHWAHIIKTIAVTPGLLNKLYVLVKGRGKKEKEGKKLIR